MFHPNHEFWENFTTSPVKHVFFFFFFNSSSRKTQTLTCCCADCGLFWCTGDTAVVIDWNTWHNSRQYFPSKPSFTRDMRCCLPVIGNLFTEVPLPHMPVQDIIAHVGFGPFHAFDIYVPLCHVKVVLQDWPCWWLFPKELISNLFPESWNKVMAMLKGCRQGR